MTPAALPPLRLTGALVLRDGVLRARSVALSGGRIVRGPLPEVALPGCLILPGIVDLHAARGADRAGAGRAAATAGVTTGWVAQGWSWEGGPASPDAAEAEMVRLRRARAAIDLRLLLCVETHLVGEDERLIALVARHGIGQVAFRDSLTGMLELAAAEPRRFAARAARAGRSPEEMTTAMREARARSREVPRHLCRLAEAFDAMGVVYGSLGDPDAETREMYSMIGARVAVFPSSRRVAAAARAMGDPVVLSAGDVAAERVTAIDLVREGRCTALASGRGWETMAAAVWRLVDRRICDLPRAWALVSAGPAEIARLTDRGRLDPGRRADLVVIREATRQVEATVSAGRLAFASGEAGARLREAAGAQALAAE
jgi:alpha-D-ribose 1-methylphosphonate 5-triphosphate diphosphatase